MCTEISVGSLAGCSLQWAPESLHSSKSQEMPILPIPLLVGKARELILLHHIQIYIIFINLEKLIQFMFWCLKIAVPL